MNTPSRRNQLDAQADSLIRYFQKRAKKGDPEARVDWLYAPALVPAGAWDSEEQLARVMRRAKDRGALLSPPFEIAYVYARPPVWTCEPTEWVRDRAQIAELTREVGAQERWVRITTPVDPVNANVAGGVVMSVGAAIKVLTARSPDAEPIKDAVLDRIDKAGIAN